jgi:hypothetical protein
MMSGWVESSTLGEQLGNAPGLGAAPALLGTQQLVLCPQRSMDNDVQQKDMANFVA